MISHIGFFAKHEASTDILPLAEGYERALIAIGQPPRRWLLRDKAQDQKTEGPGGYQTVRDYFAEHDGFYRYLLTFEMDGSRKLDFDGLGIVNPRYRSAAWHIDSIFKERVPVTPALLRDELALCRASMDIEGLVSACVSPEYPHQNRFPLHPPIAGSNFAVVTTDAAVADAYTEPDVFWRAWDRVEHHGSFRFCTRAIDLPDPSDEIAWLAHTFQRTMALARAAKPGRTQYDIPRPRPEHAPFWEPGNLKDGLAGHPVLAPVGYDPVTHSIEYAGHLPDREPGCPEPHLILQDIRRLRALQRRKATTDGRPVDEVRVVFPSEAMARPERRAIRDCGARLFFLRPNGDLVEITD